MELILSTCSSWIFFSFKKSFHVFSEKQPTQIGWDGISALLKRDIRISVVAASVERRCLASYIISALSSKKAEPHPPSDGWYCILAEYWVLFSCTHPFAHFRTPKFVVPIVNGTTSLTLYWWKGTNHWINEFGSLEVGCASVSVYVNLITQLYLEMAMAKNKIT